MPCPTYQDLKVRFELAQRRFAQFRDKANHDLISLYTGRATNIQREERANMTLLTQQMLDHRATCPICKHDVSDSKVAIEAIQSAVSEMFGLSVAELKSKNSTRAVAVPRQIAVYLAKLFTDTSIPEIGRQFGDMPHATVAHLIALVDQQRRTDPKLASTLNKLLEAVSNRGC